MRLLVTRPAVEAETLAQLLRARGHEVHLQPLLVIEPLARSAGPLGGVQALIVTSANAVPALDPPARALPLFAVGEATARAAHAAGCRRVIAGSGDGAQLAALIARRLRPGAGALVHLAGADVRPGLAEALAARGFALQRRTVYRACAVERLAPPTLTLLRDRALAAVLLLSPRTARTFSQLLHHHRLTASLARTEAICLSAATAEGCSDLAWAAVKIATRPTQEALVDLLDAA